MGNCIVKLKRNEKDEKRDEIETFVVVVSTPDYYQNLNNIED
jgi:hypothetical protein